MIMPAIRALACHKMQGCKDFGGFWTREWLGITPYRPGYDKRRKRGEMMKMEQMHGGESSVEWRV
jgi:hypothetical protein